MALSLARIGERGARLTLGLLTLTLALATLVTDLPHAARGELWGDSATYHAMAWSLARDFDLRYDERDLARSLAEYPGGPQGLFLKRASGGLTLDPGGGFPWLRRVRPEEGRLYFAKAFAHPLAVAPLVALLGTRGLTLANGLLLSAALWLGYAVLRRRGFDPGSALVAAVTLFLLTVTPVYLVWPTPEIFGLALVTAALAAWAAGLPLLSAVLLGLAGYLKPPNVLMAAPLGLDPLLPRDGERLLGPGLGRRVRESLRRGVVLALTAASLYGLNAAFTGELNYQGGARKTFYGRFPFDAGGARFDDAGVWMTTNQLGPLVAGKDEQKVTVASGPARDRGEIRESFLLNLGYFWVGRFGGVLAYFFPALLGLGLFLARGPRDRRGWLAFVAVMASFLAYIALIPDNWYGGGGTVGNRYFLGLLPAFLFLVPPRRAAGLGLAGLAAAVFFLGPILLFAGPSLARARDPRDSHSVPGAAGRAHDAQRPLGVHGALAQEAAFRLHRRCGASRRPGRLLSLLLGRWHVGKGGVERAARLLAARGCLGRGRAARVRPGTGRAGRAPRERRPARGHSERAARRGLFACRAWDRASRASSSSTPAAACATTTRTSTCCGSTRAAARRSPAAVRWARSWSCAS